MANKPMQGSAEESYARANFWLGVTGVIVIVLFVTGLVSIGGHDAEPLIPTPTVSNTTAVIPGIQEGAWAKIPQECKVVGIIAPECLEALSLDEREALRCQHEDGNPDGSPCIWINPRTGALVYSDSSEYRRS